MYFKYVFQLLAFQLLHNTGDTAHAHCQLSLKWPIHIAFSHNSATDQGRRTKFGSKYAYYTNLTFKVQNGRGLGSRDPISKFWDPPYNF